MKTRRECKTQIQAKGEPSGLCVRLVRTIISCNQENGKEGGNVIA